MSLHIIFYGNICATFIFCALSKSKIMIDCNSCRAFNMNDIGICVNFPVIFKFLFSQWSHQPIGWYTFASPLPIHRVHLPLILNY